MKILSRVALVAILALVGAVPGVATSLDGEPAITPAVSPDVVDPEAPELSVDDLEALVTPQEAEQQACAAKARCSDGSIIACSGQSFCFGEDRCFVRCDGLVINCNNHCP